MFANEEARTCWTITVIDFKLRGCEERDGSGETKGGALPVSVASLGSYHPRGMGRHRGEDRLGGHPTRTTARGKQTPLIKTDI